MEVHLEPSVEAKLARPAAERGRDVEALAKEAIENFVNYDKWFVGEIEMGLAQMDRGQTMSHEEVCARLERLLASQK